jgi:hypothetical protein
MGAHIRPPIWLVMKTTVEISDPLLREARRVAAQEGVTLRALIEQGLRRVVSDAGSAAKFELRAASFKGSGLHEEAAGASWAELRDLAYKGRGS